MISEVSEQLLIVGKTSYIRYQRQLATLRQVLQKASEDACGVVIYWAVSPEVVKEDVHFEGEVVNAF